MAIYAPFQEKLGAAELSFAWKWPGWYAVDDHKMRVKEAIDMRCDLDSGVRHSVDARFRLPFPMFPYTGLLVRSDDLEVMVSVYEGNATVDFVPERGQVALLHICFVSVRRSV